MSAPLQRGVELMLAEVGVELGVSQERVRQIEIGALRKLRHHSRADLLAVFLEPDHPEPGATVQVHCEVPEQPHEALGWGITFWDSVDDHIAERYLAKRAASMERRGLSRYGNDPEWYKQRLY